MYGHKTDCIQLQKLFESLFGTAAAARIHVWLSLYAWTTRKKMQERAKEENERKQIAIDWSEYDSDIA